MKHPVAEPSSYAIEAGTAKNPWQPRTADEGSHDDVAPPELRPEEPARRGGGSRRCGHAGGWSSTPLSLIDADGNPTTPIITGGALVDTAATSRIVTFDFLAGGGDSYPFPDPTLPSTDTIQLSDVLSDPGAFTVADPGSEQDALAEFLATNHGIGAGTPFDAAKTPPSEDTPHRQHPPMSD